MATIYKPDIAPTMNSVGTDSSWKKLPEHNWQQEILELAKKKNALILAHNYQLDEIQDVAHHTGDSLALARISAKTDYDIIIFCGVHFMAETAKILSPDKKVLLPNKNAGCSLADSITVEELREWKAEHPHAVVVSYVNTTADVKAETDICCTSSNAVDVVNSIDPQQEILFLPDQFLGGYVKQMSGRKNMHIWSGECHVHAGIHPYQVQEIQDKHPNASLYIHPECGCSTSALYLSSQGLLNEDKVKFLSTGAMLDQAEKDSSNTVLIATEIGIIHQLKKTAPHIDFQAVNPDASCKYMKMITAEHVWNALHEAGNEFEDVQVDQEIAQRARKSVDGMIAIGNPGKGE